MMLARRRWTRECDVQSVAGVVIVAVFGVPIAGERVQESLVQLGCFRIDERAIAYSRQNIRRLGTGHMVRSLGDAVSRLLHEHYQTDELNVPFELVVDAVMLRNCCFTIVGDERYEFVYGIHVLH
jgi:hypothetical protein